MEIRAGILTSKFLILHFAFLALLGCGRKGPPLPPLVLVPAAPGDLTAERRGDSVEIAFTVPANNTDKTRPANIERVDVYALSAEGRVTEADIVARGERIASVDVKAPRDPGKTIDPNEPSSDLEPLQGPGLDQGAATRVFEEIRAGTDPVQAPSGAAADGRPMLGPVCDALSRAYVGVGVSTDGRRGAFSRQASVPLIPAPPAPSQPSITYDQSGVTVSWRGATDGGGAAAAAEAAPVLDARPFGCVAPVVGYHVYEVSAEDFETPLTEKPIAEARFVDQRVEWGLERCYTVRAVRTAGSLSLESEPAPPACEMLKDTFPPAAPKGLIAIASEAAINLIWDANAEKDLAGYIVLRAPAATKNFTAATPEPVRATTFTDTDVQPGTLVVYAVQAVDQSGNRSAPSTESIPETAR